MLVRPNDQRKNVEAEFCSLARSENPDNLVRGLTIEFEIELGLAATVAPVGKS